MQISTTCWHYKLNKLFAKTQYNMPGSLCPYFWYTLWSMFKAFWMAVGAAIIAGFVFVFLSWYLPALSIYWTDDLISSFFAWACTGVIIWGITAAICKDWYQENSKWEYPPFAGYRIRVMKKPVPWWLYKLNMPKIKEKPRVEKPYNPDSFLNVTIKYIVAWHEKVCPNIKFIDK